MGATAGTVEFACNGLGGEHVHLLTSRAGDLTHDAAGEVVLLENLSEGHPLVYDTIPPVLAVPA